MSKSLGNGIDPMDICKQYGADILRLWVSSSDYKVDIRISNDILKQLTESYRKSVIPPDLSWGIYMTLIQIRTVFHTARWKNWINGLF